MLSAEAASDNVLDTLLKSTRSVDSRDSVGNSALFYAARVEGASEWKVLIHVALPLALPGLGSVAILDLLFTWNDLIWPIVTMSDRGKLPVTPAALSFRGSDVVDYGLLFAAYVSISVPLIVVFSFFVRRFVRGIEGI